MADLDVFLLARFEARRAEVLAQREKERATEHGQWILRLGQATDFVVAYALLDHDSISSGQGKTGTYEIKDLELTTGVEPACIKLSASGNRNTGSKKFPYYSIGIELGAGDVMRDTQVFARIGEISLAISGRDRAKLAEPHTYGVGENPDERKIAAAAIQAYLFQAVDIAHVDSKVESRLADYQNSFDYAMN